MKAKLTVIVGTFNTEAQARDYANARLVELSSMTFVALNIDTVTVNDKVQCTLVLATEYNATEYVLNNKTVEELEQIAGYNDIKITGRKLVNTPVTKSDVQKKVDIGEIKSQFIKYNLDTLFQSGNTQYRKNCFKANGVEFYKQAYKTSRLSKQELINKLLMYCSNVYVTYAYEISFYFQ